MISAPPTELPALIFCCRFPLINLNDFLILLLPYLNVASLLNRSLYFDNKRFANSAWCLEKSFSNFFFPWVIIASNSLALSLRTVPIICLSPIDISAYSIDSSSNWKSPAPSPSSSGIGSVGNKSSNPISSSSPSSWLSASTGFPILIDNFGLTKNGSNALGFWITGIPRISLASFMLIAPSCLSVARAIAWDLSVSARSVSLLGLILTNCHFQSAMPNLLNMILFIIAESLAW